MNLERARQITLYRIILADMLLNWVLGIVLIAAPGMAGSLLSRTPLFPPLVYRLIGVVFVLFAAWQTWIVRRGTVGAPGLIFAALMALVPVILLTSALLFGRLPLYPLASVLLWIGNLYMLLLSAWYLALAWWTEKATPFAPDLRVSS